MATATNPRWTCCKKLWWQKQHFPEYVDIFLTMLTSFLTMLIFSWQCWHHSWQCWYFPDNVEIFCTMHCNFDYNALQCWRYLGPERSRKPTLLCLFQESGEQTSALHIFYIQICITKYIMKILWKYIIKPLCYIRLWRVEELAKHSNIYKCTPSYNLNYGNLI